MRFATDIIEELDCMGIDVAVTERRTIRLTGRGYPVPDSAIKLAKNHKAALVDHIKTTCPPHIASDYTDWSDTPDPSRRGWIRTTCSRCGQFIGYRRSSR